MARRKPKLGDVKYRGEGGGSSYYIHNSDPEKYVVSVFVNGHWMETDRCRDEHEARVIKKNRGTVFAAIIREARETHDGKE